MSKSRKTTYSERCTFCGKSRHMVDSLVAGPPDIYICNECVELCNTILLEETRKTSRPQMRQAYANITALLKRYGATLQNVVEEVLFVTDIAAAAAVAKAVRGEAYAGQMDVASSLIGVAALGAPQLMVEIRCTARV